MASWTRCAACRVAWAARVAWARSAAATSYPPLDRSPTAPAPLDGLACWAVA
ncbi:MAG TPA: hypothetical protein VK894_06180 [Jiangellales bacterium]|nr:hypothetical protein [Jiangellales bacterium]